MSIAEQKPRDLVLAPRPKHGIETEDSYSCSSSSALESQNSFALDNSFCAYKFDALIGDDGTEYDLCHGDDERDEEADDDEEKAGESCTRVFLLERLGKMVSRSLCLELFLMVLFGVE